MTDSTPATAAGRMPNYAAPVTPADTHPDGCIGCKVETGPHKWTPPNAAPVVDGRYRCGPGCVDPGGPHRRPCDAR